MPRQREDDAAKYVEAARIWSLNNQATPEGRETKVERFARLLEWAIAEGLPGFEVGGVIGVAAAAEGLATSRSTLASSMEHLVAHGLVIEQPKSPYRIVSRTPILPPPEELFARPFSMTRELDDRELTSESLLAPLARVDLDDPGHADVALLRAALAASPDVAVQRRADDLATGTGHVFRRLRRLAGDPQRNFLIETTFLALPDTVATALAAQIEDSIRYGIKDISLGRLLALTEVRGLVNGRTLCTIDQPPSHLADAARAIVGAEDSGDTPLFDGRPLLRWEYALFATDPADFLSFSVCFVDPRAVHVFIREMDLEG